jgi:16S rRNA (cytosine967-C5)-methyltransferase
VAESARSLAYRTLRRIEGEGAYANLALRAELDRARLSRADAAFATDLVYGTTRMRRACDALVDRFVVREPEPAVRTLLRLGAYQLEWAGVAPHAAVGETVALAPARARGFVNAVLRRVATTPMTWPDDATRLSYPDWIVQWLGADLGAADALGALAAMDEAPTVTERADGYVQDLASQWVAGAVDAQPGERVLDLCAGPGGKATALAATGALVIGADLSPARAGLVAANAARLGQQLPVVTADGTAPPFTAGSFDRVLVDAPCSGLGTLRRRADLRWRVTPDSVRELAVLQHRLLAVGADLVRPGGRLVYSVCTLTDAESLDHPVPPGFDPLDEPMPAPWRPHRHGFRLLPHDAGTDGMVLLRYRRRP